MSDYGLKVYDSSGNIKLGVTDRITRLRYAEIKPANVSGSIDLSDTLGLNSIEVGIKVNASAIQIAHMISRSGTILSWTHANSGSFSSCDTLVYQFLYT